MKHAQGRGARAATPSTSTCPTTRPRPTCSPRCSALNDDAAVDAILFQYPPPPQIDFEAALLDRRPRQGRRRHAPGEPRAGSRSSMPGPVPCTPAGIEALLAHYEIPVAGRDVCILGRGVTLGRPLAHAAVAEAPDRERRGHRRAHRRARLGRVHAAGRHRRRRGGRARDHPAGAPHAGRARSSAAGCGTRAARCCPTSTRRARRSPGAITPRVGGVGPTTIAMLFRNLVEIAERNAGAARERLEPSSGSPCPLCALPKRPPTASAARRAA